MTVEVDEDDLGQGVIGLVMALVEVIKEVLDHEAMKRVENGNLTEEEVERLGNALSDLEKSIQDIKEREGIQETTRDIRKQLDTTVDQTLNRMINPEKWVEETESKETGSQRQGKVKDNA